MEHVRLIVAITLSLLVFVVWEMFFVDRQPPPRHVPSTEQEQPHLSEIPDPYTDRELFATDQQFIPEDPEMSPAAVAEARVLRIHTPLYTAEISERQATFSQFTLNDYREVADPDGPRKQLIPSALKEGNLRMRLANQSVTGLSEAVFRAAGTETDITVQAPRQLVFTWTSSDGVVVEKHYGFNPHDYLIELSLVIRNGSDRPFQDRVQLTLYQEESLEDRFYGFEGPSALINNRLERVKPKKLAERPTLRGNIQWLAVEDRYFITSLLPRNQTDSELMPWRVADRIVANTYMEPVALIQPGMQQQFSYLIYMGPKSLKVLNDLNIGLEKAINFGWFDFIAKPCLWFMNFVYRFIPNYGIAIIILTLMVKLLLWPLGNKSYRSMGEMKKIQPLMLEIREKYKNDRQRMNTEMMNLYKIYKVNPLSGCLPMLLQLPVFFALYRMLYEAIELRHAPFFGWIQDLSAPDRLFDFGFTIPFMEPPIGIPVLTIIMGATMFLQQKMAPPIGDPIQAKIMMLMPIMFTFIFINFSSGLVLYWLINNVLSISQQYYIQKRMT